MKTTMLHLLIFGALGMFVPGAHGFRSGAPEYVCNGMKPAGHPGTAQTTLPPFDIIVGPGDTYTPGQTLQVRIEGSQAFMIKGFMIQARKASSRTDSTQIGTFLETVGTKNVCTKGLTHTSNTPVPSWSLQWQAPADAVDDIVFRATIVQEFDVYYMNVDSVVVRAQSAVPTTEPPTTTTATTTTPQPTTEAPTTAAPTTPQPTTTPPPPTTTTLPPATTTTMAPPATTTTTVVPSPTTETTTLVPVVTTEATTVDVPVVTTAPSNPPVVTTRMPPQPTTTTTVTVQSSPMTTTTTTRTTTPLEITTPPPPPTQPPSAATATTQQTPSKPSATTVPPATDGLPETTAEPSGTRSSMGTQPGVVTTPRGTQPAGSGGGSSSSNDSSDDIKSRFGAASSLQSNFLSIILTLVAIFRTVAILS